jgi:hypothetical protein
LVTGEPNVGWTVLAAAPVILTPVVGLQLDLAGVKETTYSINRNERVEGYAALGENDVLIADVATVTPRE